MAFTVIFVLASLVLCLIVLALDVIRICKRRKP